MYWLDNQHLNPQSEYNSLFNKPPNYINLNTVGVVGVVGLVALDNFGVYSIIDRGDRPDYYPNYRFYTLYWQNSGEGYGYNIGYTKRMPTSDDVKARVQYLQKQAEEERKLIQEES